MKDRYAVTTNGRAVFYAAMWPDFRQVALDMGWTLAIHGSMASDFDIVAIAWTLDAKEPEELIEAIKFCFDRPDRITTDKSYMANHRMVYTLSIFADFYLDINFIYPNAYERLGPKNTR